MLQPATIKFLKDLKKNNNKPWFEKNKPVYQSAKTDFENFVQQIITELGKMDKDLASLEAKNCVFRIYRDVRFSKDKSPYKPNMGASMSKGGKKIQSAGYYFHCEPGQSFLAGGLYMPMPPDLAKVRQEIDYNFKEWKKIINQKDFKKYFPAGVEGVEILSRPPKGYDENNPAIEFLKMKSFIVSRKITDEVLLSKSLIKEIMTTYKTMRPLIEFLNESVK